MKNQRPKGVVPKKGQKLVNGEWIWPAGTVLNPGGVITVISTEISEPGITTTNGPAPYTYTHHDVIHPRKGMTAYERRNWLNARAGWPVKGHIHG